MPSLWCPSCGGRVSLDRTRRRPSRRSLETGRQDRGTAGREARFADARFQKEGRPRLRQRRCTLAHRAGAWDLGQDAERAVERGPGSSKRVRPSVAIQIREKKVSSFIEDVVGIVVAANRPHRAASSQREWHALLGWTGGLSPAKTLRFGAPTGRPPSTFDWPRRWRRHAAACGKWQEIGRSRRATGRDSTRVGSRTF